jgi:hypothetical protein
MSFHTALHASSPHPLRRTAHSTGIALLALALIALAAPALASAATEWRISSIANTTVTPGGHLQYLLEIRNGGDTDSEPPTDPTCDPNTPPLDPACVTLTIDLPTGLTLTNVRTVHGGGFSNSHCTGISAPGPVRVTCSSSTVFAAVANDHPQSFRDVLLDATVAPAATGIMTSAFGFSGGGAARPANTFDPTRISATPPGFGVDAFDGQVTAPNGAAFTQAGGHPYAQTTSIDFNTIQQPFPLLYGMGWPVEPPKDILVDVPPGLIGNPTAAARCAAGNLASAGGQPTCASSSQVGTTLVYTVDGVGGHSVWGPIALYNMIPPPGVPARFGFNVAGNPVTLDARLRSDGDYGFSVDARNVSEGLAIAGTSLTLWGVPAAAAHDHERSCPGKAPIWQAGPTCPAGITPKAFLRNPTSCAAPPGAAVTDGLEWTLQTDSWTHPGPVNADGRPVLADPRWQSSTFVSHLAPEYPATPSQWGPHQLPTGCANVPFDPSFTGGPAQPASTAQPNGFSFDLSLPQSDDPNSIGEADLRKAVVTLPPGVRVNPSSAQGLDACSPEQIGLHTTADPTCPDASRLAALTIETPLQEKPLTGTVYLATPHQNPFNSLIAIYLVAKGQGVIVKLAGHVELDPATGRITTTFDDLPQLPFNNMHLAFDGGPRAALTTPPACGTYTTTSQLTSWSGKTVTTTSPFTVDHASDGGPCRPATFTPNLIAGATNPLRGAFSPFTLQLTRTDQDQQLASLNTLTFPPGLLANLASVPVRCTDAQAAAASCPQASHIGTTTVGAGAGSNPFYENGDVYLTGPYKNAPFGLAIVVHALAGPFDLGYVVVRSAIQIHDDGSVTTTTEPFPTILQGIPLQLRDVRVNLDRPQFMLNPTSCAPMSITGSVLSSENQTAPLSSRFQVGECANLAFKPAFSASTAGRTSKADGASLDVRISTHQGPDATTGVSSEANIAKVDVQLPLALPSRLTTLQKACGEVQFAQNPAGCPTASDVGTAIAHVPILSSPLAGPAYLVSHGGAAFPDLVVVLQGEGITIHLTGHTNIKKGITFSHFDTAPDAPFTSFELRLPQGPNSVLAANGNLCANAKTVTVKKRVTRRVHGRLRHIIKKVKKQVAAPLSMPTTITAQNGAVLKQTTRVAVTGCPAAKAAKHARRATNRRRGR